MEVTQQTTQKETVPTTATPVKTATTATPVFPRNTRPGYDSRNSQNRKFPSSPSRGGDSRSSSRGRGGYGKRDDKDRDGMDTKLLDLSRVSHTRAGGRRLRFRAIVISGDKTGKVGLGVASGLDVAQAVEKATIQSKKNMTIVPVVKGTISHEVIAKVGPAQVMIKPQRKGRGLMAGGVVRLICQLAGIKDISSKMLGTTKNKLNNARATIKAFEYLNRQVAKKPAAVGETKDTAKEEPVKAE
jgi:small subunit ribosomal protein S5